MTTSTVHSIWLMPSGNVRDELSKTISQLSDVYAAPMFEPHITLIGELMGDKDSLITKTAQLSKFVQTFTIKLTSVDYLDEFFRCLFVHVEESDYLRSVNAKARTLFHRTEAPEYMPHLSLLYANLPVPTKQRTIIDIGSEFDLSFQVTSLHLWSTQGEPKEWYRVKEFEIKNQ